MYEMNDNADLNSASGVGSFRTADIDSVTAAAVVALAMMVLISRFKCRKCYYVSPPTGT